MKRNVLVFCASAMLGFGATNRAQALDRYEFLYAFGPFCG